MITPNIPSKITENIAITNLFLFSFLRILPIIVCELSNSTFISTVLEFIPLKLLLFLSSCLITSMLTFSISRVDLLAFSKVLCCFQAISSFPSNYCFWRWLLLDSSNSPSSSSWFFLVLKLSWILYSLFFTASKSFL